MIDPALLELMAEGADDEEVEVVIRLRQPEQMPPGARVVARFGHIITARVRRSQIYAVRYHPTVASMKAPPAISADLEPPHLEPPREGADEAPQWADEHRPAGLSATGRGVLIAHIDWGCDFAHPDFRNPDGSTRLLALWDQGNVQGPPPEPYGYGRVYTAQDINAALAQPDPYAALGYHPAQADSGLGSHGTHTLGISAGNGRGGGPVGLAPEAQLCFVDLGRMETRSALPLGSSAGLLEALDFISGLARGPCVVNMSLGRHIGEHTGLSLVEQALDEWVDLAPGRAVVQSCGNYFRRRTHAFRRLQPGETWRLLVRVEETDRTPNQLDLWYPRRDRLLVSVRGLNAGGAVVVPSLQAAPGEQAQAHWPQSGLPGAVRLYHREHDPNNGDHQIGIYFEVVPEVRTWEVSLRAEDIQDGRLHAWIERDSGCAGCQSHFDAESSDPQSTLGTICNGFRTLAVGAYNPHRPEYPLGPFSSAGPTRDGRSKPDLLAPGVMILAARSHGRKPQPQPRLYTRMSGTSMAAPHVTGTLALMYELAGPIDTVTLRRLLIQSCDPLPGDLSELDVARAGNGYLNVERAVQAAQQGLTPRPEVNMTRIETTDATASDYEADEWFFEADSDTLLEAEPDTDAEMTAYEFAVQGEAYALDTDEAETLDAEAVGPCADVPVAPAARPALLIRGSVHPAVRDAQRKLNAFSAARVRQGLPPLPHAPLVEDCIFGSKTADAVLAFQQLVFPGDPREHDSKIGPHTWAQLDAVSASGGVSAGGLEVLDDTFSRVLGWDDIVGLDTAALNLRLSAGGLPLATMPPEIGVVVTSRPPNGDSGSTTLASPVALRLSRMGADPARPGNLLYQLSATPGQLGGFLTVERTNKEVATIVRSPDSLGPGTSDAEFRTAIGWAPRGHSMQATTPGTSTGDRSTETPDALKLMFSGGAEVLDIQVLPTSGLTTLGSSARTLIRSPADVVYYSGHGLSASNCLGIHTSSGYTCWLTPAGLIPFWRSPMDLDLLIIAGCSVLHTDFSGGSASGNGLVWAGLLTTKGGPLRAILGYGASAPADNPVGNAIAREMGARLASGSTNFARDWMEINASHRAWNAVALDTSGYWDFDSGLLGHSLRGPRALP